MPNEVRPPFSTGSGRRDARVGDPLPRPEAGGGLFLLERNELESSAQCHRAWGFHPSSSRPGDSDCRMKRLPFRLGGGGRNKPASGIRRDGAQFTKRSRRRL